MRKRSSSENHSRFAIERRQNWYSNLADFTIQPKSYCGLTENLICGPLLPFSANENLLIFTLPVELREG